MTFRMNAMSIPIDIQAERLRVVGFEIDGDDNEATPQEGEAGFLWRVWQRNRMDADQIAVHASAARDGDTYAIVGWDAEKGEPTIHHELQWNGSDGVVVRYRSDNRKKIWYAAKRWVVDKGQDAGKVVYMTVYTDRKISNYVGGVGATSWTPRYDENGEFEYDWVSKDGKPLGVPVFHAANNPDGTGYGRSEIQDLLPLQNALDKVVADELAAADAAGFPIVWVTGCDVADDLPIAPGVAMKSQSSEARVGHIPAADLSNLSALTEKWITRIAQFSRTPLTFFQITGQVARADTQKAGDSPLVSKVRSRSVAMGNFWEDVLDMCRKLQNNFGTDGKTYEETQISTLWDTFESIDIKQEAKQDAETANLKADAYDKLTMNAPQADRTKLAELAGYTPDEAKVFDEPTTGFTGEALEQ
jgi:hypothetical protein